MQKRNTKLRLNDKVEVIAGKDKGRVGKILKFKHDSHQVIVERINMIKKHQKATDPTQSGQIIEKEAAIHISNIMFVCPECAETVRVGMRVLENGNKVRICKKCQATIENSK